MAACRKTKKGMTLIELMVVMVMLAVLVGTVVYMFHAVLLCWSSQETRAGIDINLDRNIEKVVRDLRKSKESSAINNDEIRFSPDKVNYYIYYLYNAGDSYPPTFSNSSYQLKKAALTGGLSGTFAYGSGNFVMSDIKPRTAFTPARPVILFTSNMANIDISITRGNETIRSRTAVKPRNL